MLNILFELLFEIRCKGRVSLNHKSVFKHLLSFISRFLSFIHGYCVGLYVFIKWVLIALIWLFFFVYLFLFGQYKACNWSLNLHSEIKEKKICYFVEH